MSTPPEAILTKDALRCLLLMDVLSVPLGLLLGGFSPARAAAGLFPLACLFLYLPLRCEALRMDIGNFFEYLEEE